MGLAFTGGDTDLVSLGDVASLDLTVGTILFWINPTSLPSLALRTLFVKSLNFRWNVTTAIANEVAMLRVRATTNCQVSATWANIPGAAANAWNFWGAQFDATSSTSTDQKIFGGTLSALATEVSSYTLQQAGSGAASATTGSAASIGGSTLGGGSVSFPGNIAWIGIWDRRLTLGEIREQQFKPHKTSGCVLFMHLGYAGAVGTQPDWSGNANNGTITGATQAVHVPLGLPFEI